MLIRRGKTTSEKIEKKEKKSLLNKLDLSIIEKDIIDLSVIEPKYLNCMDDIEEVTNESSFIKEKDAKNINLSNIREELFPQINLRDFFIDKEKKSKNRICSKDIKSTNINISRKFMPKIYIKK